MAKKRSKKTTSPYVTPPEREAVWAKLWANKRYLRLQAFKDAALRAWNQADAFQNQPGGSSEKAAKADARAKRALKRLYAFEKTAFEKAGLEH